VPHVKYAMNYRPRNSFSMSYASRKVIFPGVAMSCACTPVCIVQARLDLYFCQCIVLLQIQIHTLFFAALGYMYSC